MMNKIMYKIDKVQKENKRMHVIQKIISIILYMILIPIIIFNFTLIIKSFVHPNETPDFFGYKSFVIVSGSMEPTIMTGDAILIKEVPENEITINDIVSFRQGETNVTHRIVGISDEDGRKKYQTKGDNNNTIDKELITYEQMEGKFQFKIDQFGVMIEFLKSKVTLVILILMIAFVHFFKRNTECKKQRRKEKRKEYEKEQRL